MKVMLSPERLRGGAEFPGANLGSSLTSQRSTTQVGYSYVRLSSNITTLKFPVMLCCTDNDDYILPTQY